MTSWDDEPSGEHAAVGACPCGRPGEQPWAAGDGLWGWFALFCGALVVVAGGATVAAGVPPVVPAAIFGVVALCTAIALVGEWVAGHRGTCWAWRGLWKGLCVPGQPLRFLFAIWW